ncbi:MAG: AAA family ATPase [Deltaproteobacteria bacterium]|nr:AAA family ATPase [Deltaproteobacteria bacterium]
MYEAWFQLKEKPFSLTPDPGFLFLSGSHQQALDHLQFGLGGGEGFIVITGDIGVGKTTVCRAMLSRLPERHSTSLIVNPLLTEKELVRAILTDFGGEDPRGTKKDCLDELNRFLLAEAEKGRLPVLIVDEAQNLPSALLEQIRLLSNLETDKRKLLQIVLIGQNELKEKLSLPELRQLTQRVTVRAEILPLTDKETARYIGHRLAVAGSGGRPLMAPGAERAVYRGTRGVPRLINKLCDRAFLAAFLRGSAVVERKDVRRAAESLAERAGIFRRAKRWLPWAATTTATAILAVLAAHGRAF